MEKRMSLAMRCYIRPFSFSSEGNQRRSSTDDDVLRRQVRDLVVQLHEPVGEDVNKSVPLGLGQSVRGLVGPEPIAIIVLGLEELGEEVEGVLRDATRRDVLQHGARRGSGSAEFSSQKTPEPKSSFS